MKYSDRQLAGLSASPPDRVEWRGLSRLRGLQSGVLLGKRCSVLCRVGFKLEERCSSTRERGC